jgi:hypothetical protein
LRNRHNQGEISPILQGGFLMKFLKQTGFIVFLLTTTFLIACSGGGNGSDGRTAIEGTGTLSVALTDSSCGSYVAIYVTIDEVQVNMSTNGNSGWQTVATPMKTYNLLKLINGVTEVLGEHELVAGVYKQIRLIIGKTAESENNINGEPHPYANYVAFDDDSYQPLKIPSGYNTGIKLVHNFEVVENSSVELLLDFEACKSVVETGGGKYLLNPTIKIIDTVNKFAVFGEVTENNIMPILYITGALVSAQISDGQSASVVRSTLTSAESGVEGQYYILLSPDQTYNIVVYSDDKVGAEGSEKLYAPVCKEITVPIDENIEQNFALEQSYYNTISGDVYVDGIIDPNDPPVVYISFFSWLNCDSPIQSNQYVEVTSLSMSPDPGTNSFSFSADIPYGTYDVVASSQGFVPDTVQVNVSDVVDPIPVSLNLYRQ